MKWYALFRSLMTRWTFLLALAGALLLGGFSLYAFEVQWGLVFIGGGSAFLLFGAERWLHVRRKDHAAS